MNFWDNLKSFNTLYEKLTEPVRSKYNLTQLEFDILMFLHNNPQYSTANDIVKVRKLAKSHVSTSISSLEKKGLIKRSTTLENRKSILLKLTPSAKKIIHAGIDAQNTYGDILISGFSDKEKDQFRKLFVRICENTEAELNRRK